MKWQRNQNSQKNWGRGGQSKITDVKSYDKAAIMKITFTGKGIDRSNQAKERESRNGLAQV